MFVEHPLVNAFKRVDETFPAEEADSAVITGLAEALGIVAICEQGENRLGDGEAVAHGHEQARFAFGNRFGRAACAATDTRLSR